MSNNYLEIAFEGFFLCRLATDPDPSLEERGLSGFTYAIAGEDLLNPAIFFQKEDVLEEYGERPPSYPVRSDDEKYVERFNVKNIREASPDYDVYRNNGINVKVTGATLRGEPFPELTERLTTQWDVRARITAAMVPIPGVEKFKGPIFEGRNQIVSDGDPDRFTVNPFVFQLLRYHPEQVPPGAKPKFQREILLQRFDPLDFDHPYTPLYKIVKNEVYYERFPKQRFANSGVLLDKLQIADAEQHFTMRADWLESMIAMAEATGNPALIESFKSRLFAVNFFTQATGPTVLSNRLASRIPLRQLYSHHIRGTMTMNPPIIVDNAAFSTPSQPIQVDANKDWEILYYLGAFDGDLLSGYMEGVLTLPLV